MGINGTDLYKMRDLKRPSHFPPLYSFHYRHEAIKINGSICAKNNKLINCTISVSENLIQASVLDIWTIQKSCEKCHFAIYPPSE